MAAQRTLQCIVQLSRIIQLLLHVLVLGPGSTAGLLQLAQLDDQLLQAQMMGRQGKQKSKCGQLPRRCLPGHYKLLTPWLQHYMKAWRATTNQGP